jgi:hypothetical protein
VGRVTKEQFVIQSRRRATTGNPPHSRLCGDLTHLQTHINSAVTAIKHPKVCHVCCGEPAYSKCGLCDVTLHYFSKRGANAGAECYILYHSDAFFGLAKQDATIINKRKQDWVFPSNAAKRGNAMYICALVTTEQMGCGSRGQKQGCHTWGKKAKTIQYAKLLMVPPLK